MLAFGPVPSRRLGKSLGVNNIPPKNCPYACVYCQVGRTTQMSTRRRAFYTPEEIFQAVEQKVEQSRAIDADIDYLTFVSDGEPTLDINLGRAILQLRALGHKIGVISNSSLIWQPEVQAELGLSDWVSLKVDAVQEDVWRRVNRPHGRLALETIHEGMLTFAQDYGGKLVTETMLVSGVNDDEDSLAATAEFVGQLRPAKAYLAVPTRPPAESWVEAPGEEALHRAYRIFEEHIENVEFLIAYEGDEFAVTSDVAEDLLSITAVHPMREEAVLAFVEKAGVDEVVVEDLVAQGRLTRVTYEGQQFYMRCFSRRG